MASIKKISVPPNYGQFCHCNCGGYAKPGNKFINGHYRPKGKDNPSYGKSYNKGVPKKIWRPFPEARGYAWSLGFKNQKQWRKHCKLGKQPNDIPSDPETVYKDKGWSGWTDFLGYIPRQMKPGSALPYEEAKKIIHPLRIPNQKIFLQLSKQKKLPKGIPGDPPQAYKGRGWNGFPDFLGYDPRRPSWDISYEGAKKLIHPLKLRSERAFDKLRKQGKLPKGVPRDPYDLFKDKGWVDWPDFLGYIRRYLRSADMLPFEEAKRIIQPLKIAGQKQFHELSKQKKLPKGIPGNPSRIYNDKGWIDWPDFLGFEDIAWNVRRIKELLRGLIASNVISEWGAKEDEIVLYRILHTKGLLNLKYSNRHFEFFKNLPEAMHVSDAFREIKEYAYSDDYSRAERPPDLAKYTGIHSSPENENEDVGTASMDELAKLVQTDNRRNDPLDYDGHSRIETPGEILKSIDRIESINVDEEVMRFLVIHSVNKIWRYIITEYEKGEKNKDHITFIIDRVANSKNGNHYHDEVIDQFLSDYIGSLQIKNNLPRDYSFKYKPKIVQAYVAHKIRTRPYFLNLSGVGAGKTLSAILASRVIDNNKMTIVICPNDIVEQWAENIKEVFPDSNVIISKDAFHVKRDEGKRQYLILNYDKFSLSDSPNLILELGRQKIDFVILDEIHFVKVRGQSNDERERNRIVSQRHTNLVGLMTEIRQINKHVKVLGMRKIFDRVSYRQDI